MPEYSMLYEDAVTVAECALFEQNGHFALYPYLKTDLVSKLPFRITGAHFDIEGAYGYNGIISTSNNPLFLQGFSATFSDYCRNSGIVAEFTRFNPYLQNQLASPHLEVKKANKNILVDLSFSPETLWTNHYTHTSRKNIRKAQAHKVAIHILRGHEIEECWLNDFINIYHDTMHRHNADEFYYFSKTYFQQIWNSMKNEVLFGFAVFQKKIISCDLFLCSKKIAYYFLGGTLKEFFPIRPNTLLKHQLFLWLKENGITTVCLGGGQSEGDSLMRYKQGFSRTGMVDFFIGKRVHLTEQYRDLCNQWKSLYPEKAIRYEDFFLKYKM